MSTDGPLPYLGAVLTCGRCDRMISTPQCQLRDRLRADDSVWRDGCEEHAAAAPRDGESQHV